MAPPRALKDQGVLRWWSSVSEHVADPRHAGDVVGADRTGTSEGVPGVQVTVAVWFDRMGRVNRARWASTAAHGALVAYAECACSLLESGVAPATVNGDALRRMVTDVPAEDQRHADVVAGAVAAALCPVPLLP